MIGLKLTGRMGPGTTATDLVLTVTELLRNHGVVGKFVELFGDGLSSLTLADRATIANMSPEFGATGTLFPIDAETIRYMNTTGRPADVIELTEAYAKAQSLWRADGDPDPDFDETLELDLASIVPSLAGPRRPQDRVTLDAVAGEFRENFTDGLVSNGAGPHYQPVDVTVEGETFPLQTGSVAIAAITSCTNTSNPSVMVGAGLLAKNAVEKGLATPPWVKTSLAPGSRAVTGYLDRAGLTPYLDQLRFDLVGYGCTTCIGNSGPLAPPIDAAIEENGLVAAAVLSGNRNFEGRIHPNVRASYLASPPLVVAYALAGRVDIDLTSEPLGEGSDGPVYLADIWPSQEQVADAVGDAVDRGLFEESYATVFEGDERWRALPVPEGQTVRLGPRVHLRPAAAVLQQHHAGAAPGHRRRRRAGPGGARRLDHHRPHLAGRRHPGRFAGREVSDRARRGAARVQQLRIAAGQPRGDDARHLREHPPAQPARRGKEGNWTEYLPTGEITTIYDASMAYQEAGTPLVVMAGALYGNGSSRDWAAKGTLLLGVRAVIAKSFERIHRGNLVGMGVLPLQFREGEGHEELGLTGRETFSITGLADLAPRDELTIAYTARTARTGAFQALARIDGPTELNYIRNGGILPDRAAPPLHGERRGLTGPLSRSAP